MAGHRGDFEAARVALSELSLSKNLNHFTGLTEGLLTNPNPGIFKRLAIVTNAEAGEIILRPGDYRVLTFDSDDPGDVDDTNNTAIITGIAARYPAPDANNAVGGSRVEKNVQGPFQLSTADAIPIGLTVNVSYWIVIAIDTGADPDEVSFYTTLALANAAKDIAIAADGREAITGQVGTTNFAGMANNGLNTAQAAKVAVTDGYSSYNIVTSLTQQTPGAQHAILLAAPDRMTVIILTGGGFDYWWLP